MFVMSPRFSRRDVGEFKMYTESGEAVLYWWPRIRHFLPHLLQEVRVILPLNYPLFVVLSLYEFHSLLVVAETGVYYEEWVGMCTHSQRTKSARFELLVDVLIKVEVVWVVTEFRLVSSYRRFGEACATQYLHSAIQEGRTVPSLWTESRQKLCSEWLKLAAKWIQVTRSTDSVH
jgi:hypothetical protein